MDTEKIVHDVAERVRVLVADAEKRAEEIVTQAQAEAERIRAKAEAEARERLDQVREALEKLEAGLGAEPAPEGSNRDSQAPAPEPEAPGSEPEASQPQPAAALAGAGAVLGHVLRPELDHVAVGVGDVDRPIGAELDRPLDLDAGSPQAVQQRVELLALQLEGEVHVCPAAAPGEADLRRPQAEPGVRADQVPAAIVAPLAVERLLEAEEVTVEAAGGAPGGGLRPPPRDDGGGGGGGGRGGAA